MRVGSVSRGLNIIPAEKKRIICRGLGGFVSAVAALTLKSRTLLCLSGPSNLKTTDEIRIILLDFNRSHT